MMFQMTEGETSPPSLLTEADLISLMDKHGIGALRGSAKKEKIPKIRDYYRWKLVGGSWDQDYIKRFSSMSRCSTHNLCSEMT